MFGDAIFSFSRVDRDILINLLTINPELLHERFSAETGVATVIQEGVGDDALITTFRSYSNWYYAHACPTTLPRSLTVSTGARFYHVTTNLNADYVLRTHSNVESWSLKRACVQKRRMPFFTVHNLAIFSLRAKLCDVFGG